MKIYDLSKELFSATVYPGDPVPSTEVYYEISESCHCNVTILTLGSHNGTHMDAPKHFVQGAKAMEEVPLWKCVGDCTVVALSGVLTAESIDSAVPQGTQRLLIKGDITLTPESAEKLVEKGLCFLGIEPMSVGDEKVHRALLTPELAILESAVLGHVEPGNYFLCSQPLKMAGMDGSPARPILIDFQADT